MKTKTSGPYGLYFMMFASNTHFFRDTLSYINIFNKQKLGKILLYIAFSLRNYTKMGYLADKNNVTE